MDYSENDIVTSLRDWANIIDDLQGKANLSMLSGVIFADAADEIERLRALVDQLGEALEDECGDGDFWHKLTDPALTAWEKERARRVR